ncbi:unnamed protein product [Ceratitis capitata]|uniref:(Mediterranean fruit fly) hypothetical protein n=1 Tax=Ceratitis capitata TaxID=7213 RepID=A0A811UW84_CERCA|nr:unnamed protein product [Ceratitis capitata]
MDIMELNNPNILRATLFFLTKNVCDVTTTQEALDHVYVQVGDTLTLLNKRAVTREMLFKYLHHQNYHCKQVNKQITERHKKIPITANANNGDDKESHFPIHILARKFTECFFINLNYKGLKIKDFWKDLQLQLRFVASDHISDYACAGANEVIVNLFRSKDQVGFYCNPNLTHAEVQGQMNVHGLVLVVACGTIHYILNKIVLVHLSVHLVYFVIHLLKITEIRLFP